LSALRQTLAERDRVRGEIVLVVAGATSAPASVDDVEGLFATLVADGRSRRDAVKEIARRTGLPARDVYRRVLPSEDEDDAPED
jgi:16S rRNA (cytidine1402-2'-O)-methyltransferase